MCYKCIKGFSTDDDNKKYHKVRDHCHYTGKYRGAAHSICNFRFKSSSLSSLADNLSDGFHCDKCTNCISYLAYMII